MPTLVANQDTWFALSCSLIKATIIIRINNWKYDLSCCLIVAFVAASGKFCNLKWTYFAYPLFCFLWYYFNWLLDFVFIAELSVWLLASPAQSVQLLHQTCRTVHKGETSSTKQWTVTMQYICSSSKCGNSYIVCALLTWCLF